MKFKDYYRIIGVAPEATADDIKTAYRKQARKYHPDVSKEPDAQKRFTDIGEANEALKDPTRRAAYDELRAGGWKEGQEMDAPPPRPQSAHDGGSFAGDGGDFSDFFQSLFGRGRAAGGRPGGGGRSAFHERGEDIHAAFAVTLEESYRGGERQFTLQVPTLDEHGDLVRGQRTISVKIPKGVTNGSKVRLRGQGHPGTTVDANGDLYLEIELAPHRLFRIDGRDLSLDVPIAPWEAVLGAKIVVPTLAGTVTATVPAGSQPNQKLRLKGLGLPGDQPEKKPGDQYLTLSIAVPLSASDKAKEWYRALAAESAFNPRTLLGV